MTAESLDPRLAYRLWAPTYEEETVLSHLDRMAVSNLCAVGSHTRLLDIGCGTGRRLVEVAKQTALAVGVDPAREMLLAGRRPAPLAVGDVLALPVASCTFNLIWFRLAIGHVDDLAITYCEIARVLEERGIAVITDLHPDAAAKGFERAFRDREGRKHTVRHYRHAVDDHVEAARRSRLTPISTNTVCVGPEVRHFYADAGRENVYSRQKGKPMLLAMAFTK